MEVPFKIQNDIKTSLILIRNSSQFEANEKYMNFDILPT